MFTAKTEAIYIVRPDGTKEIHYASDKEQIGLDVDLQDDEKGLKRLKIRVDKASTPEAVIAAVLEMQSKTLSLIETMAARGAGS